MERSQFDPATVMARMRPGAVSLRGFLGDDARDLAEILREDDETVHALGLTHAQIAETLDEFTALAASGYGTPRREGPFEVVIEEARGFVPCPFGDPGRFRKGEVRLTSQDTGETLVWTPLLVHMIAAHGFYEGKGSPYRLEPETAKRVLGKKVSG